MQEVLKKKGQQIVSRGFLCNETDETNNQPILALQSHFPALVYVFETHRQQLDYARTHC